MTSDETQNRIDALRRRWEADPSSRVFVQLADEHRRAGQTEEAIQVLEAGLERQPGYVSAQVALARCRLTAGQAEQAVELLDGVVTQDPGHLLANKLLVEAHLEAGREEQARKRLEVYRMIADADPELEQLEERLRTLSAESRPRQATGAAVAGPPGGATEPDGDVVQGEVPETVRPLAESEPAAPPVAAAPAGEAATGDEDDIFGLGAPIPAPPEDLAGELGDLDLSATEAPAAAPVAAEPTEPAPDLTTTGTATPGTATPGGQPRGVETGLPPAPPVAEGDGTEADDRGGGEPISQEVPEDDPFGDLLAVAPPPAASPDDDEDLFGLSTPAAPPQPEEPPAEETSPAPAPEEPARSDADGSAESDDDLGEPGEQPPEKPEQPDEEKATVTLGQLYLSQGHLDEAEDIFRRVLRREPDNPVAHRALAELQRRQAGFGGAPEPERSAPEPPESAPEAATEPQPPGEPETERTTPEGEGAVTGEPLGEFPVPPEIRAREGLTARKVALLNHYLERLRAGE